MPLYLSHKAKRNLIAFLIFLIIILILLFAFLMRKPEVIEPVIEPPVVVEEPIVQDEQVQKDIEDRTQEVDVTTLTKTFTERYGSYSNESDFANLEDVLVLMTDGLAASTQSFIDSARVGEEYYGITTRVISMDVREQDDEAGYASVLVKTQREEAVGSPQNISVVYQELILKLVHVSGSWKISAADWQ
jgi:hypothetical protein